MLSLLPEFIPQDMARMGAMILLLVLLIAGLTRSSAPADMLMLATAVAAGLLGLIGVNDVFSGFANTAMLTVAALYVVAAGLQETGALESIGRLLLGRAKNERSVLLRLAGSVTLMSGFLNNTPLVAMFVPILQGWCKKAGVSPSRLLMPLSFFAILGGTCTLIGTSTNLLVDGLVTQAGMKPIGLFEVTWLGLPYAVIGVGYIMLVGRRLLPQHPGLTRQLFQSERQYLVNMRVQPGCRLIGQQVEAAGLRHLPGLFLTEIDRAGEIITPVRPDQRIEEGDVLTFTGVVDTIRELERIPGFVPEADPGYLDEAARRREAMLHEAVISPTSPLIGQTIRESNFRALYNAAVLAVHRGGERIGGRIGDIKMKSGDTLLLQTGPNFAQAHRNNADFYLVSPVEESRSLRDDKAMISLGLLAVLIVLLATEAIPTVYSAFLIAGLMLATGCLSPSSARQGIDWSTLITIGASFGVSKALETSGIVERVSHLFTYFSGYLGESTAVAAIYFTTAVFTELVTNNAAAALMFPFALSLSQEMGADARPFIMAIMFAASASFMTPIGYQTNLMVYGPGGYRFTDYFKVGGLLNLILFITASLLIPVLWPLHPAP